MRILGERVDIPLGKDYYSVIHEIGANEERHRMCCTNLQAESGKNLR